MSLTQEQAMNALGVFIRGKCPGVFRNLDGQAIDFRRLKFANDIPSQPALFVRHNADNDTWTGTVLPRTEVECELWIYAQPKDNEIPDTVLNGLVIQIRNALAPTGSGPEKKACTLGGLVQWARIDGRSEYYPSDIPPSQAIAIVPVKILLP